MSHGETMKVLGNMAEMGMIDGEIVKDLDKVFEGGALSMYQ
jgi:hypothetical protein